MTPGAGDLVLGCGHFRHIVKMHYFLKIHVCCSLQGIKSKIHKNLVKYSHLHSISYHSIYRIPPSLSHRDTLSSCLAAQYSAYFVVIYLFYAPDNVREILALIQQHMLKQSEIYKIIFINNKN